MTALGILGGRTARRSRPRRPMSGLGAVATSTIVAFQNDMKTAGAPTRTDGVMDAAACSALNALVADIRSYPTAVSTDQMIHDAEQRVLAGVATIQALCATGAPAAPVSANLPPASSAVPTQYAVDARVKAVQGLLNTELSKAGCSTSLKIDGLIGSGTCGAMSWAVPRSGLSADLIAIVQQNAAPFGTACSKFTATMPSCPASPPPPAYVAPAPAPAAPDGKALMVQLQGLLNQALDRYGYKTIPVSGKWDAATCGAGATVNPLLPLGDALRNQIGSLTAQVVAALGKPCGVTIAGTTPTKKAAATPAPAAPASSASDPCFIEFGTSNSVVQTMQQELNKLLDQNGYLPIPVTGKWDAASCGALYVLGGQFDPYIDACRGGYWSVPASCPQKLLPTKKPTVNASMVGYGILAALGAVGVVIAKKKGLLG